MVYVEEACVEGCLSDTHSRSPAPERSSDLDRYSPDIHLQHERRDARTRAALRMPPSFRLLTAPCAALARRARRVESADLESIGPLLQAMRRCLLATKGEGVAAPQLGTLLRLFMMPASQPGDVYVVVNPTILRASRALTTDWEGCLSVPGYTGLVTRPRSVRVAYETLQGVRKEKHLTGFAARCFQHELDHLDGRLYTERVKKGSLVDVSDEETRQPVSVARQEGLAIVEVDMR